MTKKSFRTSVSNSCKEYMNYHGLRYQDIDINTGLSTVNVESKFFAQGESADEIIGEIEKTAEQTGLNVKTCLIWYLDSAGVLN